MLASTAQQPSQNRRFLRCHSWDHFSMACLRVHQLLGGHALVIFNRTEEWEKFGIIWNRHHRKGWNILVFENTKLHGTKSKVQAVPLGFLSFLHHVKTVCPNTYLDFGQWYLSKWRCKLPLKIHPTSGYLGTWGYPCVFIRRYLYMYTALVASQMKWKS